MTQRISEFDLWRPGYGGASVSILLAGTSSLASVFKDEALTIAADNPQLLAAKASSDGTSYGKFAVPLYIASSYQLSIDGIENTGIQRPTFSSLDGEDASAAVVSPNGSAVETTLEDFVSFTVNAAMYGVFLEGSGGVAATNTATLNLAIAALSNGGEVFIPAGTYKVNSFNVPEGVVIRGAGREATTLQSVLGAVSFTIVGNRAGFKDITLDGNTLSTGSVGIRSVGIDETVFTSVIVRRFETGIHFLGGKGHIWKDFSIENTETAAKLFGDTDAGASLNGSAFQDLLWEGGLVSVATSSGVVFSYEDASCKNCTLIGVGFESCTEYSNVLNGSQSINYIGCWWNENDKNFDIHDDAGTSNANNVVVGVQINGGRMSGGEFKVTGTAQNICLKDMDIETVTFNLATPINNFVVLEDCYEGNGVVISGESPKLLRSTYQNNGASFGLTSTNTATKAWAIALKPGQVAYLEAKVVGKGRNVAQRAVYHIGCGAFRAGSTLAYDAQTANFNVGSLLTGASSGATARIQADSDSGTTGTLTLTDIQGVFLDNEIISDDGGSPGSAAANGALVDQNVSLDTVGNTNLRTAYETNASWAAVFVANVAEIELRVTGDTSQVVEWTVDVDVVTT